MTRRPYVCVDCGVGDAYIEDGQGVAYCGRCLALKLDAVFHTAETYLVPHARLHYLAVPGCPECVGTRRWYA